MSATPSPLDQLAGIEQMLRTEAASSRDNGFPVSAGHYDRAADYLAGLGKVLEEWREAYRAAYNFSASLPADISEWPRDATAVGSKLAERQDAADKALYTYLTSPRETGKEKE